MTFDPNDYTVRELRDEVLDGIDDIDALEAALDLEEEGKDRKTAHANITSRIEEVEDAHEAYLDDAIEAADNVADEVVEDVVASAPTFPDADSNEVVFFDPTGSGGTASDIPPVPGHDTIHLPDASMEEPRCDANPGAKAVRGPRSRFPEDVDECRRCLSLRFLPL